MTSKKHKKRKPRPKTRLTNLHRRIRRKLGLSKLGFRSEKRIGRFRVDELNASKKIIVEINGDAVHGNPKKFGASDKLLYDMTATQKWVKDAKRQAILESKGFYVIVVWESDNLQEKLKLIKMALKLAT